MSLTTKAECNDCPKCGYDKPIKQINPECPFKWICGSCPEVYN